MYHHIIGGVKHAQVGVGMKPAHDRKLGVLALSVSVDPGPGIGGKGEMNGAMLITEGGQCGRALRYTCTGS